MKKLQTILTLLILLIPSLSAQSNQPFMDYQKAANSEDIGQYMDIFSDDMIMIDVGRTFNNHDTIRRWAMREVIPAGRTFEHRRIIASGNGYFKTWVKWLNWEALYYYWVNNDGEIRKMSLQYSDVGETPSTGEYNKLPAAPQLYFDSILAGSDEMLEEAFIDSSELVVVNRTFKGRDGIKRFARSEVFGGYYELIKVLENRNNFVSIHLRFKPKGWRNFEPDAIYNFYLNDGLIERMDLQYKN